uniref:S-acyltransferase n=1 Tax=Tetraselmis chuii TaxID=63592 RepID=A0A7S1X3V4_9CHLO|mmetsp:Transcript_28009/g.50088  ORF Transcript_28009/g.50088 Transcript_28009/m.50088 type:complete len:293 (+) Transcript_28009:424-1302(+)
MSKMNFTVAGVLLTHAFIYGTVVACVVYPMFEYSVPGVMNVGVLSINTAMAIVCYILSVFTDPGKVPEGWACDPEDEQVVTQVKKKGGGVRFCQKCQLPKPPRCHHCRVCKRCVLRMDHHCPWVNNCIGHGNYKAFFLFLLYVTAALVHALVLLTMHAMQALQKNALKRKMRFNIRGRLVGEAAKSTGVDVWAFVQGVCFTVTFPLTIGLVLLLGWHVYLVVCNKTTIEYHEGVTAKIKAAKTGQAYKHPYDLGLCGNLHAVLGANLTQWMMPVPVAAEGDGLTFPSGIDVL